MVANNTTHTITSDKGIVHHERKPAPSSVAKSPPAGCSGELWYGRGPTTPEFRNEGDRVVADYNADGNPDAWWVHAGRQCFVSLGVETLHGTTVSEYVGGNGAIPLRCLGRLRHVGEGVWEVNVSAHVADMVTHGFVSQSELLPAEREMFIELHRLAYTLHRQYGAFVNRA